MYKIIIILLLFSYLHSIDTIYKCKMISFDHNNIHTVFDNNTTFLFTVKDNILLIDKYNIEYIYINTVKNYNLYYILYKNIPYTLYSIKIFNNNSIQEDMEHKATINYKCTKGTQ